MLRIYCLHDAGSGGVPQIILNLSSNEDISPLISSELTFFGYPAPRLVTIPTELPWTPGFSYLRQNGQKYTKLRQDKYSSSFEYGAP